MRTREGVVDPDIAELGELRNKCWIVLFFAGMKTSVLKAENVAVFHLRNSLLGDVAHARGSELHRTLCGIPTCGSHPLHSAGLVGEPRTALAGMVPCRPARGVSEGVAGAMVYGPRPVPHSFRLDSDDARVLLIFGPAGTEGFFREAGKPARSFGLPPADEQFIDRDMLMKIGNSHDQEFVGPPLPPKS